MMWNLVVLGSLCAAAYAVGRAFYSNLVIVEPGTRERVVLRDLSGKMKVLGPGTHYPSPAWTEFRRVGVNREPIEIQEDTIKTSTNVMVAIGYRYDIIAGRPFDHRNGQLTVTSIDDTSQIDDEMVKWAVTRIDYPERGEQIQQRVRGVMEKIFAGLTDKELFLIEGHEPLILPRPNEPWWVLEAKEIGTGELWFPELPTAGIQRADELYDRLSKLIEVKVNFELRTMGLNIVSFQITMVRYLAPSMQKALETHEQRQRLLEATKGDKELTEAQKFALNTDQFGEVTKAKAYEKVAESLSDGISKGIEKVMEKFMKGDK